MPTKEKALLLIASTRAALKNGVKHYSPQGGKLLKTEEEIITALSIFGKINVDEGARKPRTTTETELALLKTRLQRP